MDFQMLSSRGTVKHLQCTSCKNFLSYFPIYNYDNQNVCGRCLLPQGAPYFRNELYENMVQNLKFPCRYENEGCEEKTYPLGVPQHEKKCPYRKIKCAVVDNCQCEWEGSRLYLLQHCQDKHMDVFIKNHEFEVDLTQNNEKMYILEHGGTLLYVENKFDFATKYFECAVYHSMDETDNAEYPFQLSLKNDIRFVLVQVVASKFGEKHFTNISLEPLRARSENFPSQAVGNISFGKINNVNFTTLVHVKDLKCSDCLEFISPSFYQCSSKKLVLCIKCLRKHLQSCTTCTQLLHVIHNSKSLKSDGFHPELTNLLDHACKYEKEGCSVVLKGDEVERHEECCPFKEVGCPFYLLKKCPWKGLFKKLVRHLEIFHKYSKIQCNLEKSITILKQVSYDEFHGSIECLNSLFFLRCIRNRNAVIWTVQVVGNSEESFCYEIEIIDRSGSGQKKLKMEAPCFPLIEINKIFTPVNRKYSSVMYFDQLEEMMLVSELCFKINICKKVKNI